MIDPALVDRVRQRLSADSQTPDLQRLAAALRAETRAPAGDEELLRTLPQLRSELLGAGPIEPLLRDPLTTDVLVNAADDVWVDQGDGLRRTGVSFRDTAEVRGLAVRLAALGGRRLDAAQPWVDVRLPDGTRMHAVLPPVAGRGPYLSLRVLRQRAFTVDELIEAGTLDPDSADLLRAIVRARLAFLVSGGTGCGKTTLLATLLSVVPDTERIVVVEDSGELRPAHPHVLTLESRQANIEGAGEVTMRDLVRQALRMRPDRLVVGEVRGAEVVELLAALNTGHDGGAGTVHANSTGAVPARLEALAALGGLGRAALHSQVLAAVQCIVHLRREGVRRVLDEISLLARRRDRVVVVPAWRREGGAAPGSAGLRALLVERGVDPALVPP
ncbi:MAG: TadA family conjugal transfer-associated ATPase [Mycobacteriales bacterium]